MNTNPLINHNHGNTSRCSTSASPRLASCSNSLCSLAQTQCVGGFLLTKKWVGPWLPKTGPYHDSQFWNAEGLWPFRGEFRGFLKTEPSYGVSLLRVEIELRFHDNYLRTTKFSTDFMESPEMWGHWGGFKYHMMAAMWNDLFQEDMNLLGKSYHQVLLKKSSVGID